MSSYSIGIDLGPSSSGIAVIKNDFKLYKYKNKNLWSVMRVDAGKTAEDRRSYRNIRRIIIRRKRRLNNLRFLLEKEINKIDPTFFQRLEESFKHLEDRANKKDNYNLFIDKNFNDKHFYINYPTIYHLREELIKNESKKDIRLVYLALHHILKYRGNFLYEGEELQNISGDISTLIEELDSCCSEHLNVISNFNIPKVIEILKDSYKSKKEKVKELVDLQSYEKEDGQIMTNVFNGILGLTMNISKMQLEITQNELIKINMADEDIDAKLNDLFDILGDKAEVLKVIQKIYIKIKLSDVLNDKEFISEAMVLKYEKFKKELSMLKRLIVDYCSRDIYEKIFKNYEKGKVSYHNYINNIKNSDNKNADECKKLFYDEIKKIMLNIDNDDARYILNEIDKEEFLIKLNTTSNSIIPYQVHLKELEKIIENQGKYYEVIRENKEKIKSILTFRIPYYVGPLSKVKTEFSWMTRRDGKENEKIYPWNFNDVVNVEKSAEDFITRMTNYCSYLPSEPVLPFNSILYTEYLYYNEINKIRFNDRLLNSFEKEKLKNELFMTKNNVTEKDLMNWYKNNICILPYDDLKVTGFMGDGKVNASLKVIRDFTKIYGKITPDNISDIEKIIYYLTVFNDKKILRKKLDTEFRLNEKAKNAILNLSYSGWGRLSKKLLVDLKANSNKYNRNNIMDLLKSTNLNFMQIINDSRFNFYEKIEEINGSDRIEKINFDKHIKPLQGSPAIKKAIYQATKQIEEVIKITGSYPKSIYVEVAREDRASKKTIERNSKLLSLYENIENKTESDLEIIKKLKNKEKFKIDNERLYLYLMQRGKCMYTGMSLDIKSLSLYQIDHVIPQSLIKNNSLSNKVLVITKENQRKSSGALESKIIDNMKPFWLELLKYNLISKNKYDNLTNYSGSFGKEVEKGFINRQLVEVRQITKHVVNLLNRVYGDKGTKVYAIKTELVSDFKQQIDIFKSRDINDLHHAKDAYATAVVGMYIQKRFRNLDSEFLYDDYLKYRKKNSKNNKFGFIISSMLYDYIDEHGEVIWNSKYELSKIKSILECNDIFVVKKPEVMSGQMFKVTRCKKLGPNGSIGLKVPLKNNKNQYLDPRKYGYYEGVQEAYCSIIEFTKNKKRVKRIVGVPIMHADRFKKNSKVLKEYFESIGYESVKIIKDRIPKYQKIIYEGNEFYLVSSKEWQNAKQLKIPNEYYDLICLMNSKRQQENFEIDDEAMVRVYDELVHNLESNYGIYEGTVKKLKDNKDKFMYLSKIEKTKVINEILKLTKADSLCGNLTLIGGGNREGRLANKQNIDVNKLTFIYESYLGVNKREVNY